MDSRSHSRRDDRHSRSRARRAGHLCKRFSRRKLTRSDSRVEVAGSRRTTQVEKGRPASRPSVHVQGRPAARAAPPRQRAATSVNHYAVAPQHRAAAGDAEDRMKCDRRADLFLRCLAPGRPAQKA